MVPHSRGEITVTFLALADDATVKVALNALSVKFAEFENPITVIPPVPMDANTEGPVVRFLMTPEFEVKVPAVIVYPLVLTVPLVKFHDPVALVVKFDIYT